MGDLPELRTPIVVPEIMAPVGSWESLEAAIQGGAGSVYFGVGHLNMRSASTLNFGPDDLRMIVDRCHQAGLKCYLTANTVLYDGEREELTQLFQLALDHRVDAVIVSDISAIILAKSMGLKVHISTQANISNLESVRFFSQFADVVVLARELSLEQIGQISRSIRDQNICGPSGQLVRIELFVHGALCVAISGRCYMSLHDNGHSANRGACLQSCRRSYRVTDTETGRAFEVDNQYVMSPEDLCTIEIVDRIMEAGVSVFKIEGRARPPEYVRRVARVYGQAARSVADGSFSPELAAAWKQELAGVFNRGFWNGYYLGEHTGGWAAAYGSKATHRKVYLGKVTNFFARTKVAEILVETGKIKKGDACLFTGPTTGVLETPLNEIWLNGQAVAEASKGDLITCPLPGKVRRGDKFYRWDSVE